MTKPRRSNRFETIITKANVADKQRRMKERPTFSGDRRIRTYLFIPVFRNFATCIDTFSQQYIYFFSGHIQCAISPNLLVYSEPSSYLANDFTLLWKFVSRHKRLGLRVRPICLLRTFTTADEYIFTQRQPSSVFFFLQYCFVAWQCKCRIVLV